MDNSQKKQFPATTFNRASLREFIGKIISTDADLDRLIIDYFPHIKKLFGSGMSLLDKMNIVITAIDGSTLLSAITEVEDFSQKVKQNLYLLEIENGSVIRDLQEQNAASVKKNHENHIAHLTGTLEQLYNEQEILFLTGQDTSKVNANILDVKRQIRRGPQLNNGEIIGQGRYRLDTIIGKGGYASVWRAFDRRRHYAVALKVLHGQWSNDQSYILRFYRGARQMQALTHSRVVQVLELPQEEDGFHFYPMKYMDGGDLRQQVLNRKIDKEIAFSIIREICDAMEFAHARGLIHRDIKPSNILLDSIQICGLTDFDLVCAKDTTGGTGSVGLGTYIYASPEVMKNAQAASYQSDIYALAMTVAFILHGHDLPQEAVSERMNFFASLPCNWAMRDVLIQATATRAENRFSSVAAFSDALAAAKQTGLLPRSSVNEQPYIVSKENAIENLDIPYDERRGNRWFDTQIMPAYRPKK